MESNFLKDFKEELFNYFNKIGCILVYVSDEKSSSFYRVVITKKNLMEQRYSLINNANELSDFIKLKDNKLDCKIDLAKDADFSIDEMNGFFFYFYHEHPNYVELLGQNCALFGTRLHRLAECLSSIDKEKFLINCDFKNNKFFGGFYVDSDLRNLISSLEKSTFEMKDKILFKYVSENSTKINRSTVEQRCTKNFLDVFYEGNENLKEKYSKIIKNMVIDDSLVNHFFRPQEKEFIYHHLVINKTALYDFLERKVTHAVKSSDLNLDAFCSAVNKGMAKTKEVELVAIIKENAKKKDFQLVIKQKKDFILDENDWQLILSGFLLEKESDTKINNEQLIKKLILEKKLTKKIPEQKQENKIKNKL